MTKTNASSSFEIEELQEKINALTSELNKAKEQIQWFKEQFKLIRKRQFDKKTEATEWVQLCLFDENEADEVTQTIEPIDDEREQVTYSRKKPTGKRGRAIDTSQLPRERRVYDLSEEEKTCACGCQMVCIGEDTSEKIDYVPAKVSVIEQITPKYACKQCETIQTAKKPAAPIAKCMATANLITDVIIKKYENHLPLYRQSQILKREGIDIPDNTLGNWVMGAAKVLEPLKAAAWHEINQVHLLQADETPVKLLKPDKKGYMWAYHSLDKHNRFILFEFSPSRAAAVVDHRLQDYQGLLQTDGYSGYNGLREKAGVTTLGCWDHCRRKFTDAIKASNDNKQGLAGALFAKINKLYKIERGIAQSSYEHRKKERQHKAAPLLDEIYSMATKAKALPKSTLGNAIIYLCNHWPSLIEYIHHPEMPISNILIENQIRPFALGRKNWLFLGNETSANHSALLYSLIQTCRLNGINARQYLVTALNHVHEMRRGDINPRELLPQFIDKSLL